MQIRTALKNLPRENYYLSVVTLINRAGSMALFFLILYLHHLGISVQVCGMLVGLYGAGSLFAGYFGGLLTDQIGALKVMLLSLVLSGSALLIYPIINNLYLLSILTFLWGLFAESYRPAVQVAVNNFCLPEQRKTAYALNRLSINLGMAIGPILGGLLSTFNFSLVFIVDGMTTLMAAVIFLNKFKINMSQDIYSRNKTASAYADLLSVFKDKKMFYPLLAFILVLLVFYQVDATFPIFLTHDLHSSAVMFGLMCGLNALLIILFELPINIYSANWSNRMTLSFGALLFAIGYGSFMYVHSITGILLGVFLWTVGEMLLFPAMSAYVISIAPSEKRGLYSGVFTMGISIAFMLGPIFGTQLLAYAGPKILWLACLVIGLISTAIFFKTKNTNY